MPAHEEYDVMSAYTEVFDDLACLGPGDSATTRNLAERLRPDLPSEPRVADFGCGVGASALELAKTLPGLRALALDSHAPFIERLRTEANARGLGDRISAVVGDMSNPPSLDSVIGEFDLIWSESAIYSIGRSTALPCWRPLLKPGGWLVFSDVVWNREPAHRSGKASAFWEKEYPGIATIQAVVNELSAAGFTPLDPLLTGRKPWSNYYEPLRDRVRMLQKRPHLPSALADLLAEFQREIDVYDSAGDDVALVFFIARLGQGGH